MKVYFDLESSNRYISGLRISLSGKVTYKKDADSDVGIIGLNLKRSSLNHFDDRDSVENYFVIIKNQRAEIVTQSMHNFELGDSVVIDQEIFIYRNNILFQKIPIKLPHNAIGIYSKLRELHNL